MAKLRRYWLVLTVVIFAGTICCDRANMAAKRNQPASSQHVVMISIDGLVPDYYTSPESIGLQVPTLMMMKQSGAYAEGVEGIYPTVTYPAHTTLITGARPAIHGIVQNRIFEAPNEPQTKAWYWYSKDLKAETLWSKAKKAGLVTASVGWPVTVGAEIDYNVPEIIDPNETPSTWKKIIENSTPGLLEKALGSDYGKELTGDDRLTKASEYIIRTYRPNLLLVHLIELDGVHHRVGPRTKPAIEVTQREDGYVRRIIEATKAAGILDQTTFFLVSDHGFAAVSRRFEPNVVLVKEKLITLDESGKPTSWKAAAWPAGGSSAIVLHDAGDKETERKVNQIFSEWAKRSDSPIKEIVTRKELNRMQAFPQAAFAIEAASGFTMGESLSGPEVHDSGQNYHGTHGYLPTNPAMRASLIIYGNHARAGAKVSLWRMVDTGPTAAGLLGLTLSNAEGKENKALIK
jgi:predicted AlkP superfamily pyrophosphatase or phosphodiesterase